MAPEKLVGAQDIAEMLGVSIASAHRYTHRLDFPEPLGEVAGGRVWLRSDVAQWAKQSLPLRTGRPRKEPHNGKSSGKT